jgi:hypothetical protein
VTRDLFIEGTSATVSASADTKNATAVEGTVKGLAKGVELTGAYKQADVTSLALGARYRKDDLIDAEFSVDVLGSQHVLDVSASSGFEGFYGGFNAKALLTPQEKEVEEGKKVTEAFLKVGVLFFSESHLFLFC